MSSIFNPERVGGGVTGDKDSTPFPFAFPESSLAHKYCIGKGLEIGGSAHNPFGLDTLNVDMTDSLDTVFKKEEINLCGKALRVDIVASGDDISLLDESQDFIISSHVLEHFSNPIKALIEWDRLIKTGGIIFMIVPHKERTFDKCKNRTPLQHLIEDYSSDNAKPHGDPNGHNHCWVTEDIVGLLDWMIDNLNVKWELMEVSDVDDKVGNGFIIVIRKKGKRDSVVGLNEGLGGFDHLNNPETLFSLKDACISNLESKLRKKDALISNMEVVIRDYKQELQQIIHTEQKTSIVSPAIESLLERLEKEDISAELSVELGEFCFKLGMIDSARFFFEKALVVNPENDDALNNLGVVSLQSGDYKGAKKYFVEAIEINPDNRDAKTNISLLAGSTSMKSATSADSATHPPVSVIIPVFNNVEYTMQCLDALSSNTSYEPYEVIIVDNGSTDETRNFLECLGGDVKIIINEENLGFAIACNQGANAAEGEYLVFLNNDTIPQKGWLSELVNTTECMERIGVVSSKLLYPDGTVQHAGVVFNKNCQAYHIYRGFHSEHRAVNRMREFGVVTAACMLVRKVLFCEIGGFDEAYRNGFEDVDFCLKVREKGYKVIYNPGSVLYHFESKTPGRKKYERENSALMLKRWGDRIVPDEDKITGEDGLRVVYDKRGYINIVYDLEFIKVLKEKGNYEMAIKELEETKEIFDGNPYISEEERLLVLKELRDCYINKRKSENVNPLLRRG